MILAVIAALLIFAVSVQTLAGDFDGVRTFNQEEDRNKAEEYYEKTMDHAESAYYRAMDDVQSGKAGDFLNGRSAGEWVFESIYGIYVAIRRAAPFISMLSILCGATVCFLARRNKMLFKRAIGIGIIGIPLTLVLFVFGIGSMISVYG